jgi:hypothetical protein
MRALFLAISSKEVFVWLKPMEFYMIKEYRNIN